MNAFESFRNPEPFYYGTDFWMLNDRLEDGEIVRQLHEMRRQGVRSFIARTYIGLKSDYPGPDFKAKLRLMVRTADELGMKLFLQAGYMPEAVLDLPPAYALNYLRISRKGDVPEGDLFLEAYGEYEFSSVNSGTFLDMFNHDSVAFYLKQSYADVWKEFESDFGKGILSVWVDEPSYGGHLIPFPRGVEEKFASRWGYSLRGHLHALYLDVGEFRTVRYHFRKLLQDLLEENYFSMIRDWCNGHGLWASGHLMMEDSLACQITRAGATMPFYRFFDMPGIDVLCAQMNWRRGAIKGGAGAEYSYRSNMYLTPMQCASAARQNGQEHVLCEMYGVTSNNFTFRDQKHMFDVLAASGINHRSVHGIFYSLHGRAKRTYPVQTNYYQPYWEDEHLLYDYVASASRFISLGHPDDCALIVHPLDSAYTEFTLPSGEAVTGVQPSREALRRRDAQLLDLTVSLKLARCPFDFGDERSIELFAFVRDGRFHVGKASYHTVVLPDLVEIQATTLALVRAFAVAGGRVILLGGAPTLLDGVETGRDLLADVPGLIHVADHDGLLPFLMPKGWSLTCGQGDLDVLLSHRRDGEEEYWFLVNTDCSEPKECVLTLRETVTAELWDGCSRKRKPLPVVGRDGGTVIPLRIPDGGSLMLHTARTAAPLPAELPPHCPVVRLPLAREWRAERSGPNALLLEFCSFRRGEEPYSPEYPVLAVQSILVAEDYHGPITQRYVFSSDVPLHGLKLALEDAAKHRITLNGMPVDSAPNGYYCAKSFETIPLPDVPAGENIIEMTRDYAPLAKMRSAITSLFENLGGVELENVYLLGDFAVRATPHPTRVGDRRYSRRMTLTAESGMICGDHTAQGYPFYVGGMRLRQRVSLTGLVHNGTSTFLTLDALNGCTAHVSVNGKDCGVLFAMPYEVEVTDALYEGENEIVIDFVNTLRNLLGPYHRPYGEVGSLWGGYGMPDKCWIGEYWTDPKWYDHRTTDSAEWTDDYLLVPTGIEGAALEFKGHVPSQCGHFNA